MVTGRMGRISVFCSYAREDEPIRQELERHLAPLRAERVIDDWYDSHIQPGTRWNAEIQRALDGCHLMLFLVTPDLLASRYVSEVEIPRGIEREREGDCQVVPIMARRTDWAASPLAGFQALPGGGRWLDEGDDRERSLAAVAEGIRQVCRRIVDWENPYRRAQVGDWTHQEQTMTNAAGQAATAEGTEELIARTATEATLRLQMLLQGQVQERIVTIDLTRPLEDRMADTMRQTGQALPPNVEVSTSPAQYGEEFVSIGGRRYETVRARREITIAQRAERYTGHVTQWRCIDVPLFGVVKGEAELPGQRQYQVLLDYGHGDAAVRKPQLGGAHGPGGWASAPVPASPTVGGGGGAGWGAPGWGPPGQVPPPPAPAAAPPAVGPGRWQGRITAFGTVTVFDLLLHPGGALQGEQRSMGLGSQLHGQWRFDPGAGLLILHVVTSMMGVPAAEDVVHVRITGNQGGVLHGQDPAGRQFLLQRVG